MSMALTRHDRQNKKKGRTLNIIVFLICLVSVSFIVIIVGYFIAIRDWKEWYHEETWEKLTEKTNNPSKKFMKTYQKNDNQSNLG